MGRELRQLVFIYVGWVVVWTIFFFLMSPYLEGLVWIFLAVSILFIIKDILDMAMQWDPWPLPDYFDHAPFSILLALFYINVNPIVSIVAGIDFLLDFIDDIMKLE